MIKIAEAYRCTLLVQEPFSDSLTDRNSEDFEALSTRLVEDVEDLYKEIPGDQTASILEFK